jgi:hypothetical protein
MARHFTLTEARTLLPSVGRLIRDSVHSKASYQKADAYMEQLSQRILMRGGISVDTTAAEAWKAQRDSSAQALKQALGKIDDLGVVVKDLDVGLVDFPTIYRGEEVYLCWRMDESDIGHWHGVHEGFAGRKEIDRHFIENHRGEEQA